MAAALAHCQGDHLGLRRLLGARLTIHDGLISQFLISLDDTGGESTTVHASVGWRACQLSVIRGFARYVHVQNPVLAQIIPMGLVPSKVVHAVPFISMHPTRPWH